DHQNEPKPCSSITSGREVAGFATRSVTSAPAGSASTTWNRMPLACTPKWRHGPSIRVIDGSGAAIYQPEGSVEVLASGAVSFGRGGVVWAGGRALGVFLSGL